MSLNLSSTFTPDPETVISVGYTLESRRLFSFDFGFKKGNIDEFVKGQKAPVIVIPAKAEILWGQLIWHFIHFVSRNSCRVI